MELPNYEKIIQEILLSSERQTNKIISFIENERKEKTKRRNAQDTRSRKSSDRIINLISNSGILPLIMSYLTNLKNKDTYEDPEISVNSVNEDNKKDILTNDIPLIVCCKWLNHYLETNELLQSFIKKTLRKPLYEKFITLVNSPSTKDFEINLEEFKKEIMEDDIKDLNAIDPRLSNMEKVLLIKIING